MKQYRWIVLWTLLILPWFAGTGQAECPYFGYGVLYGNVRLSSAFPGYGQENALVCVSGAAQPYFTPAFTLTDAGGNYWLIGRLPACFSTLGGVHGFYLLDRFEAGMLSEIYRFDTVFRFQRPNPDEVLYKRIDMVLTFFRYRE